MARSHWPPGGGHDETRGVAVRKTLTNGAVFFRRRESKRAPDREDASEARRASRRPVETQESGEGSPFRSAARLRTEHRGSSIKLRRAQTDTRASLASSPPPPPPPGCSAPHHPARVSLFRNNQYAHGQRNRHFPTEYNHQRQRRRASAGVGGRRAPG